MFPKQSVKISASPLTYFGKKVPTLPCLSEHGRFAVPGDSPLLDGRYNGPMPPAGKDGSPESSRRDPGWDVLRSGFVMLVVLYHATYLAPALYPELIPRRFVFPHQVGASLLLVVSAYFACATLGRHSAGRYLWGRISRLVPAFVVAVPLSWALMRYLSPPEWWTPAGSDLVSNWLLLGNWEPARFPFVDGSFWTLPLQIMGFTAAALLSSCQLGHGRRLRTVLWLAIAIPLAQWPLRVNDPPETYRILVDGFGFHRLHLFVAGVAIWLWSNRRLGHAHFIALLLSCAFAQFVHTLIATPDGLVWDWHSTVGVCFGIIAVAVVARLPRLGNVVPEPVASAGRWLAGISYGIYLIHQTLGYILMRRLQDLGFGPTLQSLAMVLSAVLLGWLLTLVVERPARDALLHLYDRTLARR